MSIKKVIKSTVIVVTTMLVFSGCANSQYQSDENIKRSIVILIKKVERLESLHRVKPEKTKSACKANTSIVTQTAPVTKTLKRDISVFSKRNKRSIITATIRTGAVVEITACDKYGWCALKGQEGFVQRWKVLN